MHSSNTPSANPPPGISQQMCAAAHLVQIDAPTAQQYCGIAASGLYIPYFDSNGQAIYEENVVFARLRLDHPNAETGQKYHQRAGTPVHAYLPPGTRERILQQGWIIVIEGEKKALALADAGIGVPVGLGGFYGFRTKEGILVPELASVLQLGPQHPVRYYGDKDVAFNYQFGDAACELAKLIAPRPLHVSCVPLDAPAKGIDDCREELGSKFDEWFAGQHADYIVVRADTKPEVLALELLKKKLPTASPVDELLRTEYAEGFAKLAAGLEKDPIRQDEVIQLAAKYTGIKPSVIKRKAKELRRKMMAEIQADIAEDGATVIDIGQPASEWTRQVCVKVGPATFVFGGSLCVHSDGKLLPQNPAALVSLVESPDHCSFVAKGSVGKTRKVSFNEGAAKVLHGALQRNLDVLRPVEVISQIPVLAKTADGIEIVNGYSREARILAPEGNPMPLSTPDRSKLPLAEILKDFRFATSNDYGRALAFIFTIALAQGGFLKPGRAPFFMIAKDLHGAGAGFFLKMVAALFAMKPLSISPDDPKGAREDISMHLRQGANFIYLDNIRGNLLTKLPFLESLLTEPEFTFRAPYVHGTVNVERTVFAMSSNGAVLSPDLASRTLQIGIRKQPANYQWTQWPEGSLLQHVAANRERYLSEIYSIIFLWHSAGCQSGEFPPDFRYPEWAGVCSWIWDTVCNLDTPLIDTGHQEAQARLANPDVDFLRTIFRMAVDRWRDAPVSATNLLELAVEIGHYDSKEKPHLMDIGRILARHFPKSGIYPFADEFEVTKSEKKDASTKYDPVKFYAIRRLTNAAKA